MAYIWGVGDQRAKQWEKKFNERHNKINVKLYFFFSYVKVANRLLQICPHDTTKLNRYHK